VAADATVPRTVGDAGHRGMRWQSLATVTTQGVQAVVTLGVAAAVGPTEFALWGVAGVVLNAQWLIGNLGLGQALIYFRDDRHERDAVDGAFAVSLLLGLAVVGLAVAAAPAIADLFGSGFDSDEVADAVRLISLVFLFTTLAAVPQALIERALDFRRRAIPEMVAAVVYAVAAVALLIAGLGVWSLIVAKVIQSGLLMAQFYVTSPLRPRMPPRPRLSAIRRLIGYGSVMTLGAVLGFATGNLDTIAVGRWVGAAALGAYALAFTVTQLAPTFLSLTLQKVYFPVYAAVRENRAELGRAFAQGTRYLAIVMFPVTAGLLSVGPDALADTFGAEWREARPLIQILALYGLFRALSSSGGVLLAASGRPGAMLRLQAIALFVPVVLLVPFHDDATEIAWIFAAGQAAALTASVAITRDYWSGAVAVAVRGPLTATTAAVVAGLACEALAPAAVDGIVAAVVFGVVYAALLWWLEPGVRNQLGLLVGRRAGVPV
jgi:O-antigen/teichoic acid export membrane protein